MAAYIEVTTQVYNYLIQSKEQITELMANINDCKYQDSIDIMNELIQKDLPQVIEKVVKLICLLESQQSKQREQREQRINQIQQLDFDHHQFNTQVIKSCQVYNYANNLFKRIEIFNDQIITAEQNQSRIIDQDFKLIKKLDLKAQLLHKQNNQFMVVHDIRYIFDTDSYDERISIVKQKANNELEILYNVYKPNNDVYKIVELNDDIFICGLGKGEIQLFSISNQQYSQAFQINKFTKICEICLVKKEQNKYTFAFGGDNGIAIGKLIKKGNYDYQLIQYQQRLIKKGKISSTLLVNSKTIAYTDYNDHCLKIFDIGQRRQLNSIELSYDPDIFGVQEYDYELNPFAFVKDIEKISLINMRNYQIVKVIDYNYRF